MELPPYDEMMRLIRDKRRNLGIDQETLAEQVGMNAAQLDRIERVEIHANYATVRQLWHQLQQIEEKGRKTAGDVMHETIDWIDVSRSCEAAQEIMYDNDYLQMPVKEVTDNKVYKNVGSLTESDLIQLNDLDRPIGEVMGNPFAEIPVDTPLLEIERMLKGRHHALLVTEQGKYVGIITKSDLIRQGYIE